MNVNTFNEELDSQNLSAAVDTLKSGKPNFGKFNSDPASLADAYRHGDPLWITAIDALSSLQVNVGYPDHALIPNDPSFAKLHNGIKAFVEVHHRTGRVIEKGSPMDISLRALEGVNKDDTSLGEFLRGGLKFLNESLLPGFEAKGKTEGRGYWYPARLEQVRDSLTRILPAAQ